MVMSAAARKRRVTAQMLTHRNELRLCSVVSTTGNRVVLQFAGVKEEFWFRANEEPFRTANGVALDPTDEQVLWYLAHAVQAATIAGYTLSEHRHKRHTVAPAPLTNRRTARKAKLVQAARQTKLYTLFALAETTLPYFQIQSITGQEVYFRVGDHIQHVLFDPKYGRGKLQSNGYSLSLEWWSFICCFADSLLLAAQKGYRSVNPPAQPRPKTNPKPRHDPRQDTWPL